MTDRSNLTHAVRWSWLMVGGAWGAWIGFGGYFGVPRNADSFASLLATGFFITFALMGLLAGMAVGGAVGWLAERVMRRLGTNTTTALAVATLASFCAAWQVSGLVLDRHPGLRAPAAQAAYDAPAHSIASCDSPAPSDAAMRKSWEAECH